MHTILSSFPTISLAPVEQVVVGKNDMKTQRWEKKGKNYGRIKSTCRAEQSKASG